MHLILKELLLVRRLTDTPIDKNKILIANEEKSVAPVMAVCSNATLGYKVLYHAAKLVLFLHACRGPINLFTSL